MRFWSRGPIENVRPDRSPRIRRRNELTERDWENAVQGLGKKRLTLHCGLYSVSGNYLSSYMKYLPIIRGSEIEDGKLTI